MTQLPLGTSFIVREGYTNWRTSEKAPHIAASSLFYDIEKEINRPAKVTTGDEITLKKL